MNKLLAAALLTLPGLALAADAPNMQEGLWEITSKVSMPGMPIPMPAHTTQHCFTKADIAKGDKTVPQNQQRPDQKCEMIDKRTSGNTFSYKMICRGENQMTMNGQVTYDKTSYRGSAQMDMMQGGRPVRMNTEYSARRLGNCSR